MSDINEFTDIDYKPSISTILDKKYVLKYILSGNSHFSIENLQTGNKYTYKIKRNKEKANLSHMYYVYVESGLGELYAGYFYANVNIFDYHKGQAGKLEEKDERIQGLLYVLNKASNLPYNFVVEHKGRCGCCNVVLNDLEELKRGLCSLCDNSLKDR